MRPPERIGPYEVTAELGRGAMGIVFAARDPRSGEEVAIKVIAGDGPLDEHRLRRFSRELELLARLDHPHVVRVRGVGDAGGRPYVAMDLVRGEALDQRLRRGPLPVRDAVEVARKVALALAHAHALGVVHRDVKPANVLMDGDEPRLSDFGLARDLDPGRSRLSHTGQFLGTPAFMPPEQVRGEHDQVGPASDVYALGATLYALLTGEPPFTSESVGDLLERTVTLPARAPSRLRREVDAELDAIVMRCLEKLPQRRFASADDLARALERWAATPRPRPRRRALVAGLLVGLGALAAVAHDLASRPGPAPEPAPAAPVPVTVASEPAPPPAPTTATELAPPPTPAPVAVNAAEVRALVALADDRLKAGDYAGARDACERALKLDPDHWQAWHGLGVALGYLSDHLGAIDAYRRAIALAPSVARLYFDRGNERSALGNVQGAIEDYTAALERDPRMGEALVNRALDLQAKGDLAGAIADYERVIALGGGWAANGFYSRGNVYYDQGELRRAVADYDRALELDPRFLFPYLNRAAARAKLNDPAGALADFEHALRLLPPDDPRREMVGARVAKLREQLGR